MVNFVTVIPPTQEDAVLGSRKNAVRVRNIAQRVNSLRFSLRSLLFHTVHSKSDNCPAALVFLTYLSFLSDSVSRYIYVAQPEPSARQHTNTHTQPNKVRNMLLSIGFAGDQAYPHLALHSSDSDWPHR